MEKKMGPGVQSLLGVELSIYLECKRMEKKRKSGVQSSLGVELSRPELSGSKRSTRNNCIPFWANRASKNTKTEQAREPTKCKAQESQQLLP